MDHVLSLNIERVRQVIDGKSVLITGGTGSFGHKITGAMLKHCSPKRLIILSRDEFKQSNMRKIFPPEKYPVMRYFIGDVRDYDRLQYAFRDVDIVFHAAALKQVPVLEYNPIEAIKTNIIGTENVVKAAIAYSVDRVIAVSTDKCVNPANLYGATKLCLEKLIVAANNMSGSDGPKFSVLRYGNVLGSRGSVIPIFDQLRRKGVLTITDDRMTRFTLSLDEAINFVLNCTATMIGGEVFVPKLPSYNIMQVARIIGPDCEHKITGIRPGEKLHEAMISENESYLTLDCGEFYVIKPTISVGADKNYEEVYRSDKCLGNQVSYTSDRNELIDDRKLAELIVSECGVSVDLK